MAKRPRRSRPREVTARHRLAAPLEYPALAAALAIRACHRSSWWLDDPDLGEKGAPPRIHQAACIRGTHTVPGQDDGDVRRGAATSPDRAELPPLHHSAGSVTARYLRCSVRVLSGARGKAGPPWIPAAPRDESRWPCAGGSITSLHTTRPASRPAALPACSPRPRTWPDPTDQHRPSRSRLSSRSGHRRRLTSRQAHAQSRSVATWRSYRRPHAAATHRRNPPDSPRVTDRGAVQLRTLANSSATKRIHAER